MKSEIYYLEKYYFNEQLTTCDKQAKVKNEEISFLGREVKRIHSPVDKKFTAIKNIVERFCDAGSSVEFTRHDKIVPLLYFCNNWKLNYCNYNNHHSNPRKLKFSIARSILRSDDISPSISFTFEYLIN